MVSYTSVASTTREDDVFFFICCGGEEINITTILDFKAFTELLRRKGEVADRNVCPINSSKSALQLLLVHCRDTQDVKHTTGKAYNILTSDKEMRILANLPYSKACFYFWETAGFHHRGRYGGTGSQALNVVSLP